MKRLLSVIFLLPLFTRAQVITTCAGDGIFGCCLDNGPADSAELRNPSGIAIDIYGNLFIADFGNNRVRKVGVSGIITTIAGSLFSGYAGDGGMATDARLYDPAGVAVDHYGNVFISEYGNNVIRKIDPSGVISTYAGNGIIGYSGNGGNATNASFHKPRGICVDTAGNLFIADPQNNVIRKIYTAGIITTVAGNNIGGFSGDGGPATIAQLNGPFDVAADAAGNLFIADWNNFRVRKVTTAGTITTVAGNGSPGANVDGGAATNAKVIPSGIFVDDTGNVFFSDPVNNLVRKVSTAGIISTIAGNGTAGYSGDGGMATTAELSSPYDVAANSSGNIFIADELNNRIRKIVSSGLNVLQFKSSHASALFPNPANNELAITADYMITAISITNLIGETQHTQTPNSEKVTMDISTLPPGIYLIKINNAEIRKFVKE
jgi:hypothetical protein